MPLVIASVTGGRPFSQPMSSLVPEHTQGRDLFKNIYLFIYFASQLQFLLPCILPVPSPMSSFHPLRERPSSFLQLYNWKFFSQRQNIWEKWLQEDSLSARILKDFNARLTSWPCQDHAEGGHHGKRAWRNKGADLMVPWKQTKGQGETGTRDRFQNMTQFLLP